MVLILSKNKISGLHFLLIFHVPIRIWCQNTAFLQVLLFESQYI